MTLILFFLKKLNVLIDFFYRFCQVIPYLNSFVFHSVFLVVSSCLDFVNVIGCMILCCIDECLCSDKRNH